MLFGPLASRRHWPMHGPQALARTTAPMSRSVPSCPSRSVVARMRAEPGVTKSAVLAESPCARACAATAAARVRSS